MEVRYTLKDFSGINGKEPSNVTTLGYYENAPGDFNTSKPIQEFTSECFCIYTQSFKIENGDWVIVDGNWKLPLRPVKQADGNWWTLVRLSPH